MKTIAKTISVLLEDSKTIQMWASFGDATCNLTVRFDSIVGKALICGYPQEFSLYDEEDFNPEAETIVTQGDEVIILEAVIRGIKRQAKDKMFQDHCSAARRLQVMELCSDTIKALMAAQGFTVGGDNEEK